MAKVRCRVCERETQGYCPVKKTKVRLNKARTCKSFIHDVAKIRVKQTLPSEMRPEWYHDRKGAINKAKKEFKAQEEARKKELFSPDNYMVASTPNSNPNPVPVTGNPEHPLTGDLSRFTTTAGKD